MMCSNTEARVLQLFALIGASCIYLVGAGEAEFVQLQARVEKDVLEFRDRVEEAYQKRCDTSNMEQCYRGNYHGCLSSFPDASCPANNDFRFEECGDGQTCSSLFDFTTSSIRFPPLTVVDDDLDLNLVESTCFSQNLNDYFVSKREADADYWARWEVDSPWMHFAADTGFFRIFPARPERNCYSYDPRVRPFYVAASSGPKNLILVADVSGSMDGLRLDYMKLAAERVVDTLTVGDRIAFVSFSTEAEVIEIGSRSLMKATLDVKEQLKERIRNLEAVGSTNFYDAFQRVFSIMDEAIPNELVVDCNTAVLFLTDGKMTDPADKTEAEVLAFIQTGLQDMQTAIGHPVRLFTYSISQDEDVHAFPQQLACSSGVEGVWSRIGQAEDIVSSLSSYYKLFALGLGEGSNTDFTAWVEPYEFFSAKIIGTTVSAPVFDRSKDPPVLIGVAAIDFPMAALDRALDVPIGSTQTFDLVVRSSTAVCPNIDVSTCQLESFRRLGPTGEQATCDTNCTDSDLILIEEEACRNQDDFPTSVLANRDMESVDSFEARTCCEVGTSGPSDVCPTNGVVTAAPSDRGTSAAGSSDGSLGPGVIAGIVVALVVSVFAAAICICCYSRRKSNQRNNSHTKPDASKQSGSHPDGGQSKNGNGEEEWAVKPVGNLHVLQPPTNPHASKATAPVDYNV